MLVAIDGDVVASATTPLTLSTPQPGWAEQDPEAWWAASVAAIRRCSRATPDARRRGASASRGRCTRRSFSTRTAGHSAGAALVRRPHDRRVPRDQQRVGGEERLRDLASNPALEGFTLPKVLWLRNHEPAAFARLATVMLAEGLHSLSAHRRARDRAVRRVGDADVRHGAPALERGDSCGAVGLPRIDPACRSAGRRRCWVACTRGRRARDRAAAGNAGRRRRRGQRVRRGGRRRRRAG